MKQTRIRRANGTPKPVYAKLVRQDIPEDNGDLRRRAESALTGEPALTEKLPDDEVLPFIHELRVHQIELEMQNETLHQAQEALETALDRYSVLFNQAPVGYLVLSENGVILEANLAAANLLGMEQNRLKDRALTSFIFSLDQDIFYLQRRQALQKNCQPAFELRMLKPDSSRIDVQMECVRVEDQDQPSGQMMVILSDITVRKQQERDLKTYAEKLAVSNRSLESFASVASHDLQEPLRKIKTFGAFLSENYSSLLDEKGRDYLDRMQKAASRMENLIRDLLTLSRLNTQTPVFQQVSLNHIVREVLNDLEAQINRSGGLVEIGELPALAAEPILMQQLFQNLIGNALKYHTPGMSPLVTVKAELLSPDLAEIQIADNGIGFDQQVVARIFDPFVRLHAHAEYDGTGIGLAICQRIVELHAGQITARSAPGQGAVFIVQLPVRQAH